MSTKQPNVKALFWKVKVDGKVLVKKGVTVWVDMCESEITVDLYDIP